MDAFLFASVGLVVALAALMIGIYVRERNTRKMYVEALSDGTKLLEQNNALAHALAEAEAENKTLGKLARLVRQSPNGIMMMDKDGNVLSVNKGFSDMYEYTYDEFVAARGSNYRKTSFSPQVLERIDRIMHTKTPIKYEALNITKTGKQLWTQTALVPILDENNNFDGMVTIDTDIHKRIVTSDNLIVKMEDINEKIDYMAKQFKQLTVDTTSLFETITQSKLLIEQTDQIIKFIKEISDKTKILGINASIEASIAGSHGKGFRVIANEIVEISNKTIASVTQISSLLVSVSNKQNQLIREKTGSEEAIAEHQKCIKLLKHEIVAVESAISELKTLS